MASQTSSPSTDEPADDWLFDDETLRALAHLAREENLSEVEVEVGARRVSLRSRPDFDPTFYAMPPLAAAPALSTQAVANAPVETALSGEVAPAAESGEKLLQVVSPMVGVFYRAPSESEPPFVNEGDRVEVGQMLGLVETMKVFNEINSEFAGTVVTIHAKNADVVETGNILMTIRP